MQDDKRLTIEMEVSLDVDGITGRSKVLRAHRVKDHLIELVTSLAKETRLKVEGDPTGGSANLEVTLVDGTHVDIPLFEIALRDK
jgi:hypothetical protein